MDLKALARETRDEFRRDEREEDAGEDSAADDEDSVNSE
jgi:hypothetical protein